MLEKGLAIEGKMMFDEPMKKHTSFKIGGPADFFVKVSSKEELVEAIKYAKLKDVPIYILGNGSNVLVTDKGIRGLVIKIDLQDFNIEKFEDHAEVTVGSGYKMMSLSQRLSEEELSGFEELSGIPGTIGGALYMNAGAYGKELKDITICTTCMDYNYNIIELTNEEQEFSYRSSIFSRKHYIILDTKLRFDYGKKQDIHSNIMETTELFLVGQ